MKNKISIGVLAVLSLVSIAYAANITFNITTAGQDTYIQSSIVPIANRDLCAQYGLGPTCTAGDLTAKGCVAKAFTTVTKRDLVYRNCTPFTLDSAGEAAMAADDFAKRQISRFEQEKTVQIANACSNFKGFNAAQQNAICALLDDGPLPVPSTVCDICQ
jgi:phosphopantetheinyl transferase (holo-ACP synthase)